jgi:hypothetical protein
MALSGSLTKKLFESLSPSSSPREQPTTASSVASDLCRDCQSIDLKARLQCQELRSVASGAIFHLDHVPVNPSSAQCSLCLFLSRCVQEKLAETQFKRNELQGLLSKVTLKRLILTFPYNGRTRTLEGEATQSFIAKIQYGSSWIYALPLGADAFRLANRKESYARLPHPVQADRTLILSWLNECRSRHLSCSKQDKEFHLPINLPGLRLVDVHASCVVRAANEMKEYLTLSYVWGAIDQLVLNVGNIDQLSTPGAFETSFQTQLPQVIVDAMQITQELGFRYLWIDTLCICQDNVEEKTAQIAAMNLIYKGAIMTLVAAEADNAYSGLPGVRPYPQPRETVIESQSLDLWRRSVLKEAPLFQQATSILPLPALCAPRRHFRGRPRCLYWEGTAYSARLRQPGVWLASVVLGRVLAKSIHLSQGSTRRVQEYFDRDDRTSWVPVS